MNQKTQLFEPFIHLFSYNLDEIHNFITTAVFKKPGTTLVTGIVQLKPGIRRVTLDYPYCKHKNKVIKTKTFSKRYPNILYGTVLAYVNIAEYLWPKYETFTLKLYKDFKCNLFCVPYYWTGTGNFYYGLALHNKDRILMLIPDGQIKLL